MRIRKFFKDFKRVIWGTLQITVMLSSAFFVFTVMQKWIDNGIDTTTVRWILPLTMSMAVFGIIGMAFLIFNIGKRRERLPATEALSLAILEYAYQLHEEGRDQALVNLRNNFSITLHILGFHQTRKQLGELSLRSATIIRDNPSKSEVLIDDLGWANYLLNHKKIAVSNIERGIKLAHDSKTNDADNKIRLALCEAKGLRHLAVILNKDEKTVEIADQHLEEALQILNSLNKQNLTVVKRDIAQIHHARSMMIAESLDIQKVGKLSKRDSTGFRMAENAIDEVRNASKIFKDISDLDRYAKALALEVRLLEALDKTTEAREVAALRDRTLAASEWVREEGTKTLTGV